MDAFVSILLRTVIHVVRVINLFLPALFSTGLVCSISHAQNVYPSAGYVGIGTKSPLDQLYVSGSEGILNFGANGWMDPGVTGGSIITDNNLYKALMIVGSDVSGNSGKGREVKVWDYLNVQGALNTTGNATINGNLEVFGSPGGLQVTGSPGISLVPIGNGLPTLSTLSIQTNSAASTTREYLATLGFNVSTGLQGGGAGPGDKAGLYVGVVSQPGNGNIWAKIH